jgi:hypothetical protein
MNKLLTKIFAAALLAALAGPAYADDNEKIVFVTSASFKGNLGGLTGADAKCQAEADGPASIVPSGTYLAWLSDGTDSPSTRFTKTAHPYLLPDGTKIGEDFLDLTDGSILHALDIGPTGKSLGLTYYWTGTNADGTAAQYFQTCDGWTADPLVNFRGMAGSILRGPSLWSSGFASMSCSVRYKLACFQQ